MTPERLQQVKAILNFISALAAAAAAVFWFMSARSRVASAGTPGIGAQHLILIDNEGKYDLLKTLERSAKWNRWGATAAAIAAALQAIIAFAP